MGDEPVLPSVYQASLGAMGLLIALWSRRGRGESRSSEAMPLTGIALAQWSIGWVAAGMVILFAGLVVGGALVPIAILALLGSLYLGAWPRSDSRRTTCSCPRRLRAAFPKLGDVSTSSIGEVPIHPRWLPTLADR